MFFILVAVHHLGFVIYNDMMLNTVIDSHNPNTILYFDIDWFCSFYLTALSKLALMLQCSVRRLSVRNVLRLNGAS